MNKRIRYKEELNKTIIIIMSVVGASIVGINVENINIFPSNSMESKIDFAGTINIELDFEFNSKK